MSKVRNRPSSPRLALVAVIFALLVTPCRLAAQEAEAIEQQPSANERMLEPGPEAQRLARRVGSWDVVMTLRPTPEAEPIVVTGLVAKRKMIGLYLQEIMRPAPDSELPDFTRIEYLTYNAVERRWQYVSLDTRAPIGLMSARSYGPVEADRITVYFDNSALAGFGPTFEGRLFRARHVTTDESQNRDVSRQYWTQAGGPEWLAVTYEYTRRR